MFENDFEADIRCFQSQIDWVRWIFYYSEDQIKKKNVEYTTYDVWDKTKEICTYIYITEKKKPCELVFTSSDIEKFFKKED